ncbi:hypothetical protein [Nonomuraea helvata]|uniref:Uncharacterized protein n=1 Tax=Nonomuraea helvata TaxID=37484 RepID=A0ABV5RRI2_9ACTN
MRRVKIIIEIPAWVIHLAWAAVATAAAVVLAKSGATIGFAIGSK